MDDSTPPKLFKRQSGQMKALDQEMRETLQAAREVVAQIKSDPPQAVRDGRYRMANPPQEMTVPRPPAVPRPNPQKGRLGTPQPTPAPRLPMRTPSRPFRRKVESTPEILVDVVLDDELLAGLLAGGFDLITRGDRLHATRVEERSLAL